MPKMKLLTRVTLLALLFLLASTVAFADTFTIGELDLNNTIPGSADEFDLTNLTGPGGPGTPTPLTFQNLALTINGAPVTLSSTTLAAGGFATLASSLLVNSITSFHLTGTILQGTALVNGVMETIVQSFSVTYSGAALNTGTSGGTIPFTITTTGTPLSGVPEPASLTIFGSGLCLVTWLCRRRILKA
jgi:hypothetical protein